MGMYYVVQFRVTTSWSSRLAQLVERVTSNDEVSRSSRLMGIFNIYAAGDYCGAARYIRRPSAFPQNVFKASEC